MKREHPVMGKAHYYSTFKDMFEDENDLNEAVKFLSMQGMLTYIQYKRSRGIF